MVALPTRRIARADARRAVDIATEMVERFDRHHMHTHAAALAYRGALALFPFLLLVFALVQATGLEIVVRAVAVRAAATAASERGALAAWIGTQLDGAPDRALLSISVLTALWAVATGIRALRLALAVIGEQPLDQITPPLWRRIVLSLGIAPLAVVVIIAAALSLLLTAHGIDTVSAWLGRSFAAAEAFTWLRVPAALMVVTLLLAGAYLLAPRRRQTFRMVLPGAALAALCWTLMSLAFSVALATVLDYGATYGSFAAAITLLVYLQLSAVILLAGAELNEAIAAAHSLQPNTGEAP